VLNTSSLHAGRRTGKLWPVRDVAGPSLGGLDEASLSLGCGLEEVWTALGAGLGSMLGGPLHDAWSSCLDIMR
jgi:hypothetical protein